MFVSWTLLLAHTGQALRRPASRAGAFAWLAVGFWVAAQVAMYAQQFRATSWQMIVLPMIVNLLAINTGFALVLTRAALVLFAADDADRHLSAAVSGGADDDDVDDVAESDELAALHPRTRRAPASLLASVRAQWAVGGWCFLAIVSSMACDQVRSYVCCRLS